MNLKVNCGVGGRVRIVKTNSITGEVTGEHTFDNIITDYGLTKYFNTGGTSNTSRWPSRLSYGSGAHSTPHNGVLNLQSQIGTVDCEYAGTNAAPSELNISGGICTFTRTRNVVIPAKGVAWVFSELGLRFDLGTKDDDLITYTLTKNEAGVVAPIAISDVEIVTIYYTLQVQYPMEMPPQTFGGGTTGIPVSTATFKLKPNDGTSFLRVSPGLDNSGIRSFTTENFAGLVGGSTVGSKTTFPIDKLNGSNRFFGSDSSGANHIWVIDPPIVKNNTQILEIETTWIFKNVPVMGV